MSQQQWIKAARQKALKPECSKSLAFIQSLYRNEVPWKSFAAIEEPTFKPRSVVEDFDFIRARVQEIRSNKQTWWCSQCHAHRTQGCDNSACPNKVEMHEDYCYD